MALKFDLDAVRLAQAAPIGQGRVNFLVNRPSEGVHTPVEDLYLDAETGILGDRWSRTAWLKLPDGRPDPRVQVSLTNTDVMRCFAGVSGEGVFRCGGHGVGICHVGCNRIDPRGLCR